MRLEKLLWSKIVSLGLIVSGWVKGSDISALGWGSTSPRPCDGRKTFRPLIKSWLNMSTLVGFVMTANSVWPVQSRAGSGFRWLQWLVANVPSDYSSWPSSRHAFLCCWKPALDLLRLSHLNFSPGSLRPGGATTMFLDGTEVASLKFRDRWKSESAHSCYIQEAVSTLI